MTKTKRRPPSAAETRARNFEAVGLARSSAALPANEDVQVERAELETRQRKAHLDRARRFDAFEALKEGMRDDGGYDAARKLETLILTARGEHDRGRIPERVDGEGGKDRTDAMIAARKAGNAVLNLIGERDAWLLSELIAPSIATRTAATTWREVVAYITGEQHHHAQGAAVRSACANLAKAFKRVEMMERAA